MKKINEKIGRLAELTAGWETHEAIDPLERDLALELLRGAYSDIIFAKPGTEQEGPMEQAEEPIACAVPESESEPESEPEAEPETVPETEPEPEALPEPEPATEEEPEPVAEPEPSIEDASSPTEARQLSPQAIAEDKADGGNMPEPAPEAEDIPMVKRRIHPDVIRSLYGEPERRQRITQEPGQTQELQKEEPAPLPELEPEPESEPAVGAEPVTGGETAVEPEKKAPQAAQPATLGDVVNAGRQTLGETLQNDKKDMASKIAAADRRDLKHSIGINDKFLMIRDMFDGDADAFGDAIAYLDTFNDLDEAIIYIHDTYDWSADSEGVKLLVELLERKLG